MNQSEHYNCPNCKQFFKITNPTFYRSIPNTQLSIVYALCNLCEETFVLGKIDIKETIARKCHQNIAEAPNEVWACTSSICLDYYGDFSIALKEGLDLPIPLIEAILKGSLHEIGFIGILLGDKNDKS